MHIIPVLDLKAGQAVHAVRGERDRYAPVAGVLGNGGDPVALAMAYRDVLGCTACYIADLDAITGVGSNAATLRALAQLRLALWVDAGVTTPEAARALHALGVATVIVGSESLGTLAELAAVCAAAPAGGVALSVDLHSGTLRAPAGYATPHDLVGAAVERGVQHIILLDLARVGASAGPPLDLLTALRPAFPGVRFYAGGGVRGRADLSALAAAGAAGALVATALHRGALTRADVAAFG